ncbi:TetR/AcrR family transcriptional regulator [Brevibacterium daeguense]|uniref:TetR/AcrR family transcriptional regulator n=1 Tax=Brevibacterium daeguense TaxID=909936 RepID=UPI001F1E1716
MNAAAALMQTRGSTSVSMQSIAAEAGVSVGLLYKYFSNKEEILLAAISQVLNDFTVRVPQAIGGIEDPVERTIAAFRAFCEAVDDQRRAVVLTYRESRALSQAGLDEIKRREIETLQPLRQAVDDAVRAELLVPADAELFAYDLLILAHSWALKHWYFQSRDLGLDDYIALQTRTIIGAALSAEARRTHAHLFA